MVVTSEAVKAALLFVVVPKTTFSVLKNPRKLLPPELFFLGSTTANLSVCRLGLRLSFHSPATQAALARSGDETLREWEGKKGKKRVQKEVETWTGGCEFTFAHLQSDDPSGLTTSLHIRE